MFGLKSKTKNIKFNAQIVWYYHYNILNLESINHKIFHIRNIKKDRDKELLTFNAQEMETAPSRFRKWKLLSWECLILSQFCTKYKVWYFLLHYIPNQFNEPAILLLYWRSSFSLWCQTLELQINMYKNKPVDLDFFFHLLRLRSRSFI